MLEKKIFIGGLDSDTEDRVVLQGDYRYALNIRNSQTQKTAVGAIENVLGNTLIEYELPLGTNRCIGTYSDELNRIVYYFVYNSRKNHSILEYDAPNNIINKVLQDEVLNFKFNKLILHVDKIDDLLYWTDGYNQPRKINISRAKNNQYPTPFIEKYINNIQAPPLCPPTAEYGSDTNIKYNNIRGKLFQFKYKYVYADNEESAWSPISQLALPEKEEYYNYITNSYTITINNIINISLLTGDATIKKIKVAMREGNLTDFLLVEELDKVEDNIPNNSTYVYKWTNDKILSPILVADSNRLFDSVPLKAEGQAMVDGKRLTYWNVTDGYDLIKPNVSHTVWVEQAAEKGTPVFNFNGGDKSGSYFNNGTKNTIPQTNIVLNVGNTVTIGDTYKATIHIAYNDYATYFGLPSSVSNTRILSDTFTYTAVQGDTPSTIISKLQAFIFSSPTLMNNAIPVPIPPNGYSIINGSYVNGSHYMNLSLSFSTSGNQLTISGVTTNYIHIQNNNNFSTDYYIFACGIKVELSASSVFPVLKTLKRGSKHAFGLVYYDEYNRSTTTITDENMVVPVGFYSDYAWNGRIRAAFNIKHKAPKWAKKYQLVYGGNQTIEKYGLSLISSVQNPSSGKWTFKIGAKPSTMEGYRVRFIGNKVGTTYYQGYFDFPVTEYDTGTFTATIYVDSFTPYDNDIIEFYIPKLNKDEIIYYEIGQCYDINDGYHQGNIQHQTPTQDCIIATETGDVYLRSADSLSDKIPFEQYHYSSYYTSNYTDKGRPNKVDASFKQAHRQTTAFYSEPYIPNTNINGLNTIYDLSFEEYDLKYGGIKKVYAEDGKVIVFQQKKVGQVLVNESIISDSSGNSNNITKSDQVLYSKMQYYAGEFGIGNNPESFAVYGTAKYFCDAHRGAVLRLSNNGITPISEYKMKKYFSDLFKTLTSSKNSFRIFGVWDVRYNEYILHVEVLYDNVFNKIANKADIIDIDVDVDNDLDTNEEWLGKTVLSIEAINSSSLALTWNDTANLETGWEVWRGLDYNNFQLLVTLPSDSVYYLDTTCQSSTTYFYKVRPISNNGNGDFSNVVFDCTPCPIVDNSSGGACADATAVIKDSAGTTLKTEAIPSNVSENITINDCTVTVNGDAFDTVLAEGSIDVPVEYANGTPVGTIVSGVVEIPNPITPSGIVYQRPSLSGQLTSYRTGDDAWHLANGTYNYTPPTNPSSVAQLDTAHATPFLMLKANNVFGNKNRFTDDGGNQTYANDYVIDHLTGLGWYRLTQGASTNWSDNIDAAEASTILSYTDWRMANVKEYDSIGNRRMVGFNYAPFSLTGSPIAVYQTSTTDNSNTSNYVRYQITALILQSSDAKTTALANRAMLLVRNHY